MTCIAITAGGTGAILKFDSRQAAFEHAVVQFGDAIVTSVDDVQENFNRLEWVSLMQLAGLEVPDDVREVATMPPRESRQVMQRYAPQVWDALVKVAVAPPAQLEDILAMVARDRRTGRKVTMTATETATTETKPAKAAKAPKAEKAPKVAKAPKVVSSAEDLPLNDYDTIHIIGKNAEGKPFTADPQNTPHRPDSERQKRFSKLVEGMTVDEASKVGITGRHVRQWIDSKVIELKPGVAPAETAQAA